MTTTSPFLIFGSDVLDDADGRVAHRLPGPRALSAEALGLLGSVAATTAGERATRAG